MIIIDEIDRRSVSKTLDERVAFLNNLNQENAPELMNMIISKQETSGGNIRDSINEDDDQSSKKIRTQKSSNELS